MNLVSSNAVIGKVIRDYGLREDKSTLIEWIGEAMEGIGIDRNWCQESVAFVTVENYQALLPNYCRTIIQIARNNTYVSPLQVEEDVINATTSLTSFTDCNPVPLDEFGQPLTGVDYAYYRPYFDYVFEYQFWYASPLYQESFTPVRLADHNFFNNIVAKEDGIIYTADAPEYTIVPDIRMLRFNFEMGQVAISYLRQITDEQGYPMVPDDYSYMEAVSSYIIYRKQKRDFFNHVEGSTSTLALAEKDWQFYCRQAKNRSMMPQSVDDYEKLKKGTRYLLPPDKYKSFRI